MSYKNNYQWIARYQDQCEQEISSRSIFCVATSEYLARKLEAYNPKSFEIRLGAPTISGKIIEEFKHIRSQKDIIRVGVVGFLKTINSNLLTFLLSHPEIDITIVGSASAKEISSFSGYSNIHFTGNLIGKNLYKAVSQFDVGIIPYNIKSSIDRTPNKLWLYLSFGKPVVITNIKGIRNWVFPERFLYRCDNNTEFYSLILKAYKEDDEQLTQKRIEFAQHNTWDSRMNDFIDICENIQILKI